MIKQLVPTELHIYRGDVERAGPGLVSESFNDIHPTATLEFNQVADRARFITAIYAAAADDNDELTLDLREGALNTSYRGSDVCVPLDRIASRLEVTPHLEVSRNGPDTFRFVVQGIGTIDSLSSPGTSSERTARRRLPGTRSATGSREDIRGARYLSR